MHTKLTLNIDKEVIETAKLFAKSKKISLSKIVEKYLTLLPQKSNFTKIPKNQTPLTNEISHIAQKHQHSTHKKDKEILIDTLSQKYL